MDYESRRLDAQIDQSTAETLDATERILRTATDAQAMGVDTLGSLIQQGEIWRWCDGMNMYAARTVCMYVCMYVADCDVHGIYRLGRYRCTDEAWYDFRSASCKDACRHRYNKLYILWCYAWL